MFHLYFLIESDYYNGYFVVLVDKSEQKEDLDKYLEYYDDFEEIEFEFQTYLVGVSLLEVNDDEDVFYQVLGREIQPPIPLTTEEQADFLLICNYMRYDGVTPPGDVLFTVCKNDENETLGKLYYHLIKVKDEVFSNFVKERLYL